ncbi:MAG: hypothetical protein ACLFNU_02830 [Bacteroidales bacterium]
MRKIVVTLALLLLISSTNWTYSQNYRNRQVTLFSYNCDIHQSILSSFEQQAHLFPETDHRKADKIVDAVKDRAWYMIKEKLEEGTGMYILPINAYGKSFKYDVYGFPDMSINRALRKGSSRYYLKIDLTISSALNRKESSYGALLSKDSAEKLEETLDDNAIVPKININATTYSDKGVIPVQRVTGNAIASQPWQVSEEIFNGIVNHDEFDDEVADSVLGLVNAGLTDLLKNF